MKRKEYKWHLQAECLYANMKYLRATRQTAIKKAIKKTGIRWNIQLWAITSFPLCKGNFDGKTYWRRLFPHIFPHGNHTFILCRLWHKGFPTVREGGGKSNYYNRAPLQHKHNLEAELFMLAVHVKAINLQPHNHHTVFEVYIYRAGNTPHILLKIFLNMVSIDSLV